MEEAIIYILVEKTIDDVILTKPFATYKEAVEAWEATKEKQPLSNFYINVESVTIRI